jgi:transposase
MEVDGVRNAIVWQRMLGLTATVIEGVIFDEVGEVVVVSVRPRKGAQRRCGRCGRRAPWYDRGDGRRRWRGLDLGTIRVELEAEARRVNCRLHGPTVAQVPWARHGAGHTRDFDDTVAWLSVKCSKTAVTELMRIAWRTVGAILTRVQTDIDAVVDRLAGLRRIGIDEIAYKRNHKYLTIVVDHDSGRLVWAAAGRDQPTLARFFVELGPQRCAALTHVSADGANWIDAVLRAHAPQAVRCADAFHVVAWATEALDEVRRATWNQAPGRKKVGSPAHRTHARDATGVARSLKRSRWALWKNPDHLTEHQQHQLAWITKTQPELWRAYLLKEGMRYVFAVKGEEGKQALDRWISWARRSRIEAFVQLQRRIVRYRPEIEAALDAGLSNAIVESTNTKIRLLTRVAYGFHKPEALIALALLALGGHRPQLPR